jgi:hypothetical protein
MASIPYHKSWDVVEENLRKIWAELPTLTRSGSTFSYTMGINAHIVDFWAIPDAPRYCARIDNTLSFRCSNMKALLEIVQIACRHNGPWTSAEVWDVQTEFQGGD